jgi:hypothetical protein
VAPMGVAVWLVTMVGQALFEDGLLVLVTFGRATTLASKLLPCSNPCGLTPRVG